MLRMVGTRITKKRSPTNNMLDKQLSKRMLLFTVAAAFSTNSANAFVLSPSHQRPPLSYGVGNAQTPKTPSSSNILARRNTPQLAQQTRLYSSKDDSGLLKRVAKTLLPKKWFQSEEEQKADLARQEVKDQVQGGIKELLKDAPLPVRMMGSLISPLLSNVASNLSESLAEQQKSMDSVLEDSRAYILGDDVALQALGEPIQVGTPFSQSSSTSIMNGQKTTKIVLGFPVEGSVASGVAQAEANEQGVSRLVLQVNGRQINVSLSRRGSPSASGRVGKNHQMRKAGSSMDDNIIEAEIIEKKKDS